MRKYRRITNTEIYKFFKSCRVIEYYQWHYYLINNNYTFPLLNDNVNEVIFIQRPGVFSKSVKLSFKDKNTFMIHLPGFCL